MNRIVKIEQTKRSRIAEVIHMDSIFINCLWVDIFTSTIDDSYKPRYCAKSARDIQHSKPPHQPDMLSNAM
jgi:hypothetical protein